jgi:hypothetical protein
MPTAATKTRRQKLQKNPSWFLQQQQQQQQQKMQEEKALRDPHYWRLETLESPLNATTTTTTTTQNERRKKVVKEPHYMHAPVFTALISYHSNTPAAAAAARGSVSFHGHHLHQCSNGQSLVLHNSSPRARAVGDGTAVDGRG